MTHRTSVNISAGTAIHTVHAGEGYWFPLDDASEVFAAGDEVKHLGGGDWFPVPPNYYGQRYGCGCPAIMRRPLPSLDNQ